MGSKNRIAKYILPIILRHRLPEMTWVEPFVGGGNMIDKVDGIRIGADSNKYVIEALLAIQNYICDLPKNNTEFTEDEYKKLRLNDDYRYKGYAGFAFSYGGKWLGGWCRDKHLKRDYVREAFDNAIEQHKKIKNVTFIHTNYSDLIIPEKSIIYCDPPYEGTTKYKDSFNHTEFWDWCRNKRNDGHKVFISEYNAPDDFKCIWELEVNSSLTKDTGSKKAIEKLFTL
jgi:DNA adenine methylase